MAILNVKVQPRSSQNRLSREQGMVKAWVTAAPTDGQANRAIEKLIAKEFGVAPSRVSVIRGETARQKGVEIEGVTEAEISLWLNQNPENPTA